MIRTRTVISSMSATLALATVLASPASAAVVNPVCKLLPILCSSGPPKTPEIDPGMARGTLTLLIGGVLMLAERRRR